MDSAHLTHIAFSLFFPLIVLLLLILLLPAFFTYKLFHPLLPSSNENMARKVVLITGASSGIGEQLAYQYAKRGAFLVLVARRENALKEVAESSRLLGSPEVLVIPADVSQPEECRKIVEKSISHFGQLDHLVVNAGLSASCLFEEVEDIACFTKVMDVNFWGSVYPTHYSIPHLRRSKGRIIVTSSMAGQAAIPRASFYCASKAAQIKFYETLRIELGSDVKITIATLGFVVSEITKGKLMLKEGKIRTDQEETKVIGPLPIGSAEECAEAIVSRACKGERYVTWPTWYKALHLVLFVVPEIFDWFMQSFYVAKRGSPAGNALSKRILDMIGANKFHPASMRSTDIKMN